MKKSSLLFFTKSGGEISNSLAEKHLTFRSAHDTVFAILKSVDEDGQIASSFREPAGGESR